MQELPINQEDLAVATAKQYPRDVAQVIAGVEALLSFDTEELESCFYSLPREGKQIEGLSVRFAELLAQQWGNLRIHTRTAGTDGRYIVGEATVWDLQTNIVLRCECMRQCVDKYGRPYSDSMMVTTGQAAQAIAFRNAVLKVIPRTLTLSLQKRIRERIRLNVEQDVPGRRAKMFAAFEAMGVQRSRVLNLVGAANEEQLGTERIVEMLQVYNAIKGGDATVADIFGAPEAQQTIREKITAARASRAKQKQGEKEAQPQP